MKNITITNFTSSNGNRITNQFLITTKTKVIFQSYNSIIAERDIKTGKIILDVNKWDYSNTTGKYRNQFLRENITETRKKIKSGVYKLKDLN